MKTSPGKFSPAGTKILPCSCHHPEQDKTHGKSNRVHNRTKKGYRCTVCADHKLDE